MEDRSEKVPNPNFCHRAGGTRPIFATVVNKDVLDYIDREARQQSQAPRRLIVLDELGEPTEPIAPRDAVQPNVPAEVAEPEKPNAPAGPAEPEKPKSSDTPERIVRFR